MILELIDARKQIFEKYGGTREWTEKDRTFLEGAAEKFVSPEGRQLREEVAKNPEYLIELFFVVVNKKQVVVPFFLNHVQKIFIGKLNQAIADFEAGKRNHLKFLLLKGRQQG